MFDTSSFCSMKQGVQNILPYLQRFFCSFQKCSNNKSVLVSFSYSDSKVPHHPCFRLVANSEQNLFTNISRRLLTMEKTHEYNVSKLCLSLLLLIRIYKILKYNSRSDWLATVFLSLLLSCFSTISADKDSLTNLYLLNIESILLNQNSV